MEDPIADRNRTIVELDECIVQKRRELDYIQTQITDGESAFSTRSVELDDKIRELKTSVNRLGEQARQYEEGMKYTRGEDKKRREELDQMEIGVKARERSLYNDRADLEREKRQFQQLKELSS